MNYKVKTCCVNKPQRKSKEQSKINNPETQTTTLGTQDRTKTNKQTKNHTANETIKMNNTDPTQKPRVNPGASESK